jgi:hypothetical protein|tara:strand:+ start:3115 stop:3912 length:798 start_codon:yes stop_codon:yes gene_type:complete
MKIFIIIIIFILGLLFCGNYKHCDLVEGFSNSECPNLLIQKGKELHLIYSNKARIPGVNPIKFKNLEDYNEFLNWQRAKGIRCPVLYFQQTFDAQNKKGYRMLPDITEKQGGLSSAAIAEKQPLYDANHDDAPYNVNSYPGFDAQDQYVGANTNLDDIFNSSEKVSANAMDVNWGGAAYAEKSVDSGGFAQDSRIIGKKPYIIPKESRHAIIEKGLENSRKANEIKHPSKVLEREIATRYGGHIANTPENSAIGADKRAANKITN